MAKKIYYKKDKKAQIYVKQKGVQNEWGDWLDAYRPIAQNELWCYTKQLSQEQRYIASCLSQNEVRLFVFNYLADVKLYDLLKYKGEWYSITRVDHTDDYNTETFIYVDNLGNRGPDDDEILPYTPPNGTNNG